MKRRVKAPLDEPTDHQRESHTLWFNPLLAGGPPPPLIREHVVGQALTAIAQDGVGALTMRTLAARLGVVPGATATDATRSNPTTWFLTACSPRSTATSTHPWPGPNSSPCSRIGAPPADARRATGHNHQDRPTT